MADGFRIPFQEAESEFVEKRSRFISHVWRVETEEEAQARIQETKKKYYDARHNCWCYLLGPNLVRYSDDGEPQGTAGQPMLNVFQRENVTGAVCVVTRYFGGILLGAGGLTRAYSKGAKDVLEAAEQKIYAIRRGRSAQSMATIQVVLQEVMEHLAELSAQGGKTLPGLSTGFSAVDGKINGLNKSDLLLLAARPGMGKTSMALNVALNAAKESGQTVAVFSLEMSRDQLVTRLLASEGLIENTRLISGDLRESDWVKIAEGASSLSRLDIRIDDNPLLTVADMNAKCRRIDNLGLVVIDYLQLMTGNQDTKGNREQEVAFISRTLKAIAKELNVPMIALSQLSRATEMRGGSKRPQLSDLRESGAIEQDADIVAFIHRPEYYGINQDENGMPTAGMAEIILAKHRNGAVCDVNLRFLKEQARFADVEDSMLPPAQAAESQQAYDDYASGSNSQPGTSGLGAAMGGEFDVNRSTKIDDEAPF